MTLIALAGDRGLRRLDGIWYELRLADLPHPIYRTERAPAPVHVGPSRRISQALHTATVVHRLVTQPVRDALTGALRQAGPLKDSPPVWSQSRRCSRDPRYVTTKRQLGGRELRRHGLVNELPAGFSS